LTAGCEKQSDIARKSLDLMGKPRVISSIAKVLKVVVTGIPTDRLMLHIRPSLKLPVPLCECGEDDGENHTGILFIRVNCLLSMERQMNVIVEESVSAILRIALAIFAAVDW